MTNLKINHKRLDKICRKYEAGFLGVFGSVAKGDNTPDSDVDVLVEFAPNSSTSLMGMVRMETELGEMLGRKVDLVTKDFLSKYFRDEVLRETKPIYG